MSTSDDWVPGTVRPDVAGRRGLRGMGIVLRRHRGTFAIAVCAGIGTQALGIIALAFAGVTVARALEGAGAGEVVAWSAATAACVLLRAVFLWIEAWVSHELAYRILAEVRLWLFDAFARMGPAKLARRRSGEAVSAAMDDSQAMEMFYAHSLLYAAAAAVLTPLTVLGIAIADPITGAIVAAGTLAAGIVPLLLRRANHRQGRRLRSQLATTNADAVDLVDGLAEVTSLRGGADLVTALHRGAEASAALQRRQSLRVAAEQGMAHACTVVTLASVAAWLLLGPGEATITTTLVLLLCCWGAFDPVHTLLGATRVWGVTTASADRIFDVVEEPASVDDDGAHTATDPSLGLELRCVDYRYPQATAYALRDVSFSVAPGEVVALVGHSGAGKSTTTHLVARLQDPERGEVVIGGVPARDLTLRELRRLVAVVPQDVLVLNESLADNLRLGRPDLTDTDLAAAVATSGLAPLVARLPDGLATLLGDRGARLSGGERQRIALARALARDPRILLVDEGTSMLDALSEVELRDAMAQGRERRATLVIAHRLSTIAAADRVVMLDQGRVRGTGTHADLLETHPGYRRLVIDQLQGLSDLSAHRAR